MNPIISSFSFGSFYLTDFDDSSVVTYFNSSINTLSPKTGAACEMFKLDCEKEIRLDRKPMEGIKLSYCDVNMHVELTSFELQNCEEEFPKYRDLRMHR